MEPFFLSIDDAFLKKERDKARKLRATQWWKRKRSSGICHYCQNSFLPKELTMDHIVPLARGGKSEKFNVVPCCKECNTKKKQMLPVEWDEYMSRKGKSGSC
ncbi:MAG: HNH endonuclease [Proteobacteria bacterium]|nr:HNH endonuclease [Pseudomonadota bacterium]MBU1387949.1 HNH endonuclease [Pseudomonadota bacterium]MBU1542012.1 HNH endonuclease [Pseudomonadota bacterium]MBU2480573.1 HNH endonuclease [Pseudomonadota bacterium]